jgi:2'-5' RNA ligase
MPRLFSGIELPLAVRRHLGLVRAPLDGARWIEPEDMHITLRFLGDVDRRTANEFADLISDVQVPPFRAVVRGLGSFGGRQPRALWAAIDAGPELRELNRLHERAARASGLAPESRAFKPHVTIARLKHARPDDVAIFLGQQGAFVSEPFTVERVVLYSARPGTGGGPYVVEETFPLAGVSDEESDNDAAWRA